MPGAGKLPSGATSLGWTVTKLADDSLDHCTEALMGTSATSDQFHVPIDRWIHVVAVRGSDTILFLGGMLVASYEESGAALYDIRSDSSIKLGHRGTSVTPRVPTIPMGCTWSVMGW